MQLVEREDELASLGEVVDDAARSGTGRVVIVRGPAGIGKSSLVDAGCRRAADEGFAVCTARGDVLETGLDYGILRQLVPPPRSAAGVTGPAAAGLAALGYAEATAGVTPGSAVHGLYWLLSEVAAERGAIVAVDDAQWADASSLTVLAYLARRLDGLPIVLTLGWRPGDAPDADAVLDRIATQAAATVVAPRPLTPEGVATLTGASGAEAAELHRATAGNPFLVREAARAGGALGSEGVRSAVVERLRRLGADAVAICEAVGIVGDDVELAVSAELAAVPLERAAAAADLLVLADILAPGPLLRFVHPIVREAVRDSVGPQRRAVLHARAAGVLEDRGAPAELVARHLRLRPPTGDARAAEQLAAAGQSAVARGALDEGIALLERALAEPPAEGARAGMLAALGSALKTAGRAEAAAVLREAIAADDDPRRRLASRLALVQAFGRTDLVGAVRASEQAAAEAESLAPEVALAARASLLAMRLAAYGGAAELPAGLRDDPGGLPGETPGERAALMALAYRDALLGARPASEVGVAAERALAGGTLLDDLGVEAVEMVFVLMSVVACDRLEAAVRFQREWLRRAQACGSVVGFAMASQSLTGALLTAGEVAEAELHADGAYSVRSVLATHAAFLGPAVRALAERGRFDEAEQLLSQADEASSEGWPLAATNLAAVAQLRAAQGRWREAADAALKTGEQLARRGTASPALTWRADAAVGLAASGERDRAVELAREQLHIAEAWGTARAEGAARRALGVALGGEEGIAELRRAVAVLEGSPSRLELIRAMVDLGAALRRRKERVAGREVLLRALDLATRGGATVLATRAREEVAATGARPRRALLSGAESLTPSERRIAALAAEGRSNPEIAQALFLSRRTVEAHLTASYRKLDIASRDQLAAALGSS